MSPIVVGIGDCKWSSDPSDVLITHALGSCIAVMIHDPVLRVTGMLHFMLPESSIDPEKTKARPFAYADTGIPLLFQRAYQMGAVKARIRVMVAGGAQMLDPSGTFNIGKRNHLAMRKVFWKAGVLRVVVQYPRGHAAEVCEGPHMAFQKGLRRLAFANRLNQMCRMNVREAAPGDHVRPGVALIAPGGYHLILRRAAADYIVELQQGPLVCYQRPSVDVMFASVAQAAGDHAIGVLLTGMGSDGAKGMLALKHGGAPTIAQDEASCVVYGMPREAVRLDAVSEVASLDEIPAVLLHAVRRTLRSGQLV
jgi:chemotaxis receptor (MCP) glutamine deamidase CheD